MPRATAGAPHNSTHPIIETLPSTLETMESGRRKIPSGRGKACATAANIDRPMPMAATACLLLIILLGVALLVWWSAVFHPGNEQLWMVPLGLLMVGTPSMICFALSSDCTSPAVVPDPDPER